MNVDADADAGVELVVVTTSLLSDRNGWGVGPGHAKGGVSRVRLGAAHRAGEFVLVHARGEADEFVVDEDHRIR